MIENDVLRLDCCQQVIALPFNGVTKHSLKEQEMAAHRNAAVFGSDRQPVQLDKFLIKSKLGADLFLV